MAQRYFSTNRGTDMKLSTVTAGSSSTSGDDIEIRFNDAVSITELDLEVQIEKLQLYIRNRLFNTNPAN